MKSSVRRTLAVLALAALAWPAGQAWAQGVTTGSISGTVTDPQHQPVPGATVVAVHEPSGTRYETTTRSDGRFDIPSMRVGSPYTLTVSLTGFQPLVTKDVAVRLGVATDLTLTLRTVAVSEEVTVTGTFDPVFSSERTGAATTVQRDSIATLPTIQDRINDFARLSPQYTGGPFGGSFVGQDNRYNNFTVDGSYFNNSFGLAGQPGDRTGVAPISMSAIEEIQVNVAPYDVREGNFVGAGVNTVTRSGTNSFRGSAYYWFRNQDGVGTKAKDVTVNPGTFDFHKWGGWVSGPVLKNKLFFFASAEPNESFTQPATTFVANSGGQPVGGNTTRVLASDLDALSSYLSQSFNYDTGGYQGYSFETPAKRYLGKLDYNLNDRNKITVRYLQLDSSTPVLESNSSSLGNGGRRTSTLSLNFENSNYTILENIRSGIAEWNSIIGSRSSNSLQVGYSHNDESRGQLANLFPLVDILQDGSTYTSFGSEPFTPDNKLTYQTFQLQDSFTMSRGDHTITFGGTVQRYNSNNVFFPGSQSVYVYNSLQDFYTDANDYLANPNRTTSPVTLKLFQVRWNNIPGSTEPLQPLKVWYSGIYGQDEWQASKTFKLSYGIRLDLPVFADTGYQNTAADALSFRDENGQSVQYQSKKLPDANILYSPRVGFNWDVSGDHKTQVRGGTGVFTGPPAYVWISNQVGNTGTLTGFLQASSTTAYPFNPDPNAYKPATVTGAPPPSFELALTDPNFKFPQTWRTDFAVDRKLPWGVVGTAEFLYNRDVNGIYYINANLAPANTAFTGVDGRPRWTTGNRINANVTDATVLKNESVGRSWLVSAALEKRFKQGFLKAAYSYGQSKNTVDPGSIAFGSWTGNAQPGDPNNPGLGYSSASPGHRIFVAGSYRLDYLKFGATTVSVFWTGYTNGDASYTYAGDLNGDGASGNDLIYIPKDTSEMNFQTYTSGGKTYTSEQQAQAWEAYIQQDAYLSSHRGQYAQRNAVFLPMVFRADMSLIQDIFKDLGGKRHTLQFRLDILNLSNLLNHNWGVSQRMVNSSPLIVPSASQGGPADAQGKAQYRLATVGGNLISSTFQQNSSLTDVYQLQFQLRYTFN
jgi:Carboxypeptidase regulatory-like domain